MFINADIQKEFAKAVILEVGEKKLGEVTYDDFAGNGFYESEEVMYRSFRDI